MMHSARWAGLKRRVRTLSRSTLLAGCLACVVFAAALVTTGCGERVAPVRTLPSWVRGIYVPVFKNTSYEPGIEEMLTRAVQEAFLADGRLDIVPRQDADLLLKGEVTDWAVESGRSRGDHISTNNEVTMTIELKLFEPLNEDEPIAILLPVVVSNTFYLDTRSVDFTPEPDRKRAMFDQAAQQIVNQTLTGFPIQLRQAPVGAALPPLEPPPTADTAPTARRPLLPGF